MIVLRSYYDHTTAVRISKHPAMIPTMILLVPEPPAAGPPRALLAAKSALPRRLQQRHVSVAPMYESRVQELRGCRPSAGNNLRQGGMGKWDVLKRRDELQS